MMDDVNKISEAAQKKASEVADVEEHIHEVGSRANSSVDVNSNSLKTLGHLQARPHTRTWTQTLSISYPHTSTHAKKIQVGEQVGEGVAIARNGASAAANDAKKSAEAGVAKGLYTAKAAQQQATEVADLEAHIQKVLYGCGCVYAFSCACVYVCVDVSVHF